MISYLKGKINMKSQGFLIIGNQGIGYKVFVASELFLKVETGQEIEIFTHQYVREDALQLFGFATYDELQLFELLISISGIGPKTALGVFAVAKPADIKSAIINEDASILRKVSGIGTKTAERIVLELKNKIAGVVGQDDVRSKEELDADIDAIDALIALGFARPQARDALKDIDQDLDVGERVKAALQFLNK